jgi:hypothetical protein
MNFFKGLGEMASSVLTVNELKNFNVDTVKSWEERFDRNKAHLLFARRLWLASSGTSLIAFYSDIPTVGIDLWSLAKLDKDTAKILALWLNSSFNILQLLYIGVACEGPWMKLHGYMMDKLLVPDPTKLSVNEKKRALELFDKIGFSQFPSIVEQLRSNYFDRKLIDEFWLGVLGYDSLSEDLLTNFYASLHKEIVGIGNLMSGKTKP